MKNILTIAVFGDISDLNATFEDTEIISASDTRLKKCKSKYTVFLSSGFTYADLRPLLDRAENSSSDIIAFEGGCIFKTSSIKHPDISSDIFNLQINCVLDCKSIEKTGLAPFKPALDFDCSEDGFERLKNTVKYYTSVKGKAPVEVYSYARDLICERLVLFYKNYMLAIKKGADYNLLTEFDRQIKTSDMVLYKVFENRFNHDELEKLRLKNFKISFITAIKYKKELKIK